MSARYLALSAIVLAVAACSSGSSHHLVAAATSRGAFLKAVNTVCARAVSAHAGHSFPLSNFDPEHPDASHLPIVGNYFARYGQLPQTVAALKELEPPPADTTAWQRLLTVAEEMRDNAQRQIAAADARDVKGFVATVHTVRRLTNQMNADGRRFGFSANSPCAQAFG